MNYSQNFLTENSEENKVKINNYLYRINKKKSLFSSFPSIQFNFISAWIS